MELLKKIDVENYFLNREKAPMIDVRSPAEFEQGHIPGAVNIPLFDNDERAVVGTLYKQQGRKEAMMKGLEIVGPQMLKKAKQAMRHVVDGKLFVHCWRGGMRSESMAWLFSRLDIECTVLEGGYRAYRRYIHSQFARPWKFVILGGMTGSGKTELLHHIADMEMQMIDLEGLANHKGSAYGGIGKKGQPTTEQFENDLYLEFFKMNIDKLIWLEDESKPIGRVVIPDDIYFNMRKSKVVEVRMPKQQRIKRLAVEYAELDPEELKYSTERIKKRLGGENTRLCLEAIDNKDFDKAIDISLMYYDKTYTKGLKNRDISLLNPIEINGEDMKADAALILDYYRKNVR